jgi:hypothetical protein
MSEKLGQFSTAFSTFITAILSKKLAIDNTTYAALTTLISMAILFITTQLSDNLTIDTFRDIGYHNIIKLVTIATFVAGMYRFRWIFKYFFDIIMTARNKEVEIHDTYYIGKIIKYMKRYERFFKIQTGVCITNFDIDYTRLKTKIFFDDKNYNVKGYIQFNTIDEEVALEESEIKKQQPKPEPKQETKDEGNKQQQQQQQQPQEQPKTTKTVKKTVVRISRCICKKSMQCNNAIGYINRIIEHNYIDDPKSDIDCNTSIIYGEAFVTMKTYINTHKRFYKTTNEIITDIGDITKTIFFPKNEMVYFDDTEKHVSGFISWTRNIDTHNDEICLKNCRTENGYTIDKYINDIKKEITNKWAVRHLTLYNVDKTRNGYETVVSMFDEVSMTLPELENRFIRTLFHPKIGEIWNRIKMINYYPDEIVKLGQPPRMNMILYGPPGTGKSTCAYRFAMATKRHLVSVRLSRYQKNDLYKLFTQPTINGISYKPKDIIFVLDEFDNDIEKIVNNGNHELERIESMKKVISETFVQMEKTPVVVSGQQPQQSTQKPSETSKRVETEFSEMEKMVNGINSIYDKIEKFKDNIITLKDLLVIFQGSVPIDGCIIIAMTNKYHEICEKCPALFRTERLTPIQFGNFDVNMINEVSKYYFHREINYKGDISSFDIQPAALISKIMEICLMEMSEEDKYRHFVRYLNRDRKIEFY